MRGLKNEHANIFVRKSPLVEGVETGHLNKESTVGGFTNEVDIDYNEIDELTILHCPTLECWTWNPITEDCDVVRFRK